MMVLKLTELNGKKLKNQFVLACVIVVCMFLMEMTHHFIVFINIVVKMIGRIVSHGNWKYVVCWFRFS